MERKIIKTAALFLMICTLVFGIVLSRLSRSYAKEREQDKPQEMSGLELLDYFTTQSEEDEEELEHQMRITLPSGMTEEDIAIRCDYVQQLVTITIPGIDENYFYDHPLLGSSNHIDDLMIGSDIGVGVIEITLDQVYEIQSSVQNSCLYLDFMLPHDLYEKVVVVDAGHGGTEPGAVKQGVLEKGINLAIVLELKKLLDENGKIKVYYTRTEDVSVSLDQRVQLANKADANLFVSVHSNSTKDGKMSNYHGTEVMYDEEKADEEMGSMQFSEIMLSETVATLGSKNDGLIRGHNIYIIRTSQVPVALVEVGFMTSLEELESLQNEEYQKKAAQGIYNGIIRALEEGY
ncbi:N-acetylmuramoyl-L-alanine amidase [Lachnospiraceae bacterium ZAX-1]